MKKFMFQCTAVLLLLVMILSTEGIQAQRWRKNHNKGTNVSVSINQYQNSRYYPVRGQVFYHKPTNLVSLQYRGRPYYYQGGFFYSPLGGNYQIIHPPVGIRVNMLPGGFWSLRMGGLPYYYFNGIFYKQQNKEYEVVKAPIGAQVPALPRDAKVMVIDGEKLYEYNGTFYKEYINPEGQIWYTVEGKHGVLHTPDKPVVTNEQPQTIVTQPQTTLKIGDILNQLPTNVKTIVIDGKKYLVTPENVYLEEFIDGNTLKYKVIGI
jgi:hypothetical protein